MCAYGGEGGEKGETNQGSLKGFSSTEIFFCFLGCKKVLYGMVHTFMYVANNGFSHGAENGLIIRVCVHVYVRTYVCSVPQVNDLYIHRKIREEKRKESRSRKQESDDMLCFKVPLHGGMYHTCINNCEGERTTKPGYSSLGFFCFFSLSCLSPLSLFGETYRSEVDACTFIAQA